MSFLNILNRITIVAKSADDIKSVLSLSLKIWQNLFFYSCKILSITKKHSIIFQKLSIDSFNSKNYKFFLLLLWQLLHANRANLKQKSTALLNVQTQNDESIDLNFFAAQAVSTQNDSYENLLVANNRLWIVNWQKKHERV